MKKILLLLITISLPVILYAQHPRGSFSGKNYVLQAETEITLKDGSKISCKDKIDGIKIGKTNVDYKDVDYIRIVKVKGWGWKQANGTTYKYITIDNEPQLVRILVESPKLSFYMERPIMTGGGYNGNGTKQHDSGTYKVFMIKDTNDEIKELNYTNIKKFVPNVEDLFLGKELINLFPDCPRLIQYQKDMDMKDLLSIPNIVYIYNNSCSEANSEEMEVDKKEMIKNP